MTAGATSTAPLRIGLSARLLHEPPAELGFRGKTLQYLEQSAAHWILRHGALALMVPTLGFDAEVERRKVSVGAFVAALDGLVLQGGADLSPATYGQTPLEPEWSGDAVRDRYEMELIDGFIAEGKPVLGICRGMQLLNVVHGGTLLQDILRLHPGAHAHVDPDAYDLHRHRVRFEPGGLLERLHPEAGDEASVISIHHQAVDRLGGDLVIEARSTDDGIVEAIRGSGRSFVLGLQWHPEFHPQRDPQLLSPTPVMTAFLEAAEARRAQGRADG